MTTLILGCGFLGLEIARQLRADEPESEVVGTTRSPERFDEVRDSGARPVVVDLLVTDTLRAIPAVDRIVHCVALKAGGSPASPDSRIEAMTNFLDWLNDRKFGGRLVHVSTTSVYGQSDGSIVDEESPAEPATEAGMTARRLETMVEEAGRSGVTLRMAGLYGPDRIIGRRTIQEGKTLPGDPGRWLNLIHVEDAARVVAASLRAVDPAPLYVACDDRPITRGDYYQRLARQLDAPAPQFDRDAASASEPNRRLSNRRMREGLGVVPRHPSVLTWLDDSSTLIPAPERIKP